MLSKSPQESSTPVPLSILLDVSTLETASEISSRFNKIAEAMLYHHCLRIQYKGVTTDFELLEIEFYLHKHKIHEDPFCHAPDEQQIPLGWRFHRAPRKSFGHVESSKNTTFAGGYRGGTRKGLDLTFGTAIASPFFPSSPSTSAAQCRGGILLRTMRQKSADDILISGPSLLVDNILKITESRNIAELVTAKLGGSVSAFPPNEGSVTVNSSQARICLVHCPRSSSVSLPSIHRSPRVGLDLSHHSVSPKNSNSRVIHCPKLYRYLTHPHLLKANGRCHTLVGIYLENAAALNPPSYDDLLVARLAEATGLKIVIIKKYLDDYLDGFKRHSLAEYVGSAGKGASSNPKMFMKMMGVLARMQENISSSYICPIYRVPP